MVRECYVAWEHGVVELVFALHAMLWISSVACVGCDVMHVQGRNWEDVLAACDISLF